MAHQSRFISVNLNKSYGKSSSSSSSSAPAFGNGRPRSAGGSSGMVVLSRPRSSSGAAAAHKPVSRLSVPPPINLPSLRKEHERLDPASSKPLSGHGGSGMGSGQNSSMSWTKPTLPVPEFHDKEDVTKSLSIGEQRSFGGTSSPQASAERAVILKGEDFPSLLATSNYYSRQKQKQVSENSDTWAEKAEPTSALEMRPQLRSSLLTKSNAQCNEGGMSQIRNSQEQEGGNFPEPLPLVRLRHTSDWDDDERDRNHGFSGINYNDRPLLDGETRSSLSRDSGRGDIYGKKFMASKKEDRNTSSWRVTMQPNRDLSSSHLLHVDRDHIGPRNFTLNKGTAKESSYDRLSYGDRRDFSLVMGTWNAGVAEASTNRVEVSSNWQRGKPVGNGMISKGPLSPRTKGFSATDHMQSFTKEKLVSSTGKVFAESSSWAGKDIFSSDVMLDLNAKVFRKRKEAINRTDLFDPVRESFEAELERVQCLQEQERQRVIDEQARVLEFARRESEERERIAREEEERRHFLEEEAREAVWRAEQEKMEAVKRAEEQKIAREEEKKKILMEEERRKEAARQKLLELEARIARRQSEAATNDRMKEMEFLKDSDIAEWEKSEKMAENITSSPAFSSSGLNRLPETGFKPHTSTGENYSFAHKSKPAKNWTNNSSSIVKDQGQDSVYPSLCEDTFSLNRGFHRKQFHVIQSPKSVMPSFRRGMLEDQTQKGESCDRNRDSDQTNVRDNVDTMFNACDHVHIDGNQSVTYSERSFQNNELDELVSFSRVRHTARQPRVPPPPSLSSSMCRSPFHAASVGLNSPFFVDTDPQSNQTLRNDAESDMQILYGCNYHQRILEPGTPDLLEESTSSFLQTEEKSSPRYDSQSSLSVSNPPSSPTQLSHDEFDDCGGSPTLTTSVEEENITFSDVKPMIPELDARKFDADISRFSNGEDDEWAVEDSEEIQEEEDDAVEGHDEGPDSIQNGSKRHDSDVGELEMKNTFENLDEFVEKQNKMCDSNGIANSGEDSSTIQGLVSGSMSELTFSSSSTYVLQSEGTIIKKITNASSELAEVTDTAYEDLFFGPLTNLNNTSDSIRESKISGQNPIAAVSRFPLPSTSSLCSISSSECTSGQYDEPAKLQFGLFSSPPLIPSPLPTIQIGSIQMPLPLNAHNDSHTQMNHSRYPLFQFGRVRYTPAISQSALPISAQSMPFVHPPIARHSTNQSYVSSPINQVNQDSTMAKDLNKVHPSFSADEQPVCAPEITNPNSSQSTLDSELFDATKREVLLSQRPIPATDSGEKKAFKIKPGSDNPDTSSNQNFRSTVHSRRARSRPHFVESYSTVRNLFIGQKVPGIIPAVKKNRLTYSVRNSGSLPSLVQTEASYVTSNRLQRRPRRNIQGTEYRVKESDGPRQMQYSENVYYSSHRFKPTLEGAPLRNACSKVSVACKSTKLMNEAALSGDSKKQIIPVSMGVSDNYQGLEVNLSNCVLMEDDIDAPLRSGIVRVFNQPGIEASPDGDGFVEVRSKKKISNERRGQRQRESNSKLKMMKAPRKHHANLSSNEIVYKSEMLNTLSVASAARNVHSDLPIIHRRHSDLPITSMAGQTAPPINSSPTNSTEYDRNSIRSKSSPEGSDLAIANEGVKVVSSLSSGNDIVSHEKASVPLGNWATVHLNQKTSNSSHAQIDENLDHEDFSSVSVAKVSPGENNLAISSATKEKPSFSSENLLSFSFDGEKIQFGAVSSPSPLPSPRQSDPSGIWPPCSGMLNASNIHNLPINDHCQSNLFDKEKCLSVSCTNFDDTEAEAEAAASAVAVAAISNDEITISKLGTCSKSGNGTKIQSGKGMKKCTDAIGQSASEESLVVTLPADLSVDTTLSLWPPLPNLQSSRPIPQHITGPQPSPFPFFDPNPMIGGPIFAFRPQDESTVTQAQQQQQSTTFVSGPTGTWPQCHSGADSFYGSPAGFPAPFISPSAGISSVQSHSSMVFYNHFAPIGQFGQVGLSYMGNNYIPTGKQPDWKHGSDGTATVNANKTESGNLSVVYGQQTAVHMPTPIQHLPTGSAVMQVTSPFTMFNLRPFQSSSEIPVQAQWHHPLPHPSSHPIRHSPPPEQLASMPLDASGIKSTSHEPHSAAANLPDELGLESTSSNSANSQSFHPSRSHPMADINKNPNGISCSVTRLDGMGLQNMSSHNPQDFERTASPVRQRLGPIGKVGSSLNTSSDGEWGRRNPFQGKHRNGSSNKNVGPVKTKQIYVAKSLLSGSATSSLSRDC